MNQRVLITGASGLLGRDFLSVFDADAAWEARGLAFSRAGNNLQKCDLTDPDQVTQCIKDFKPSVIIHSAAERRPDVVEKEEEKTRKINVEATQRLCDLAKEVGAYVIFISTDYVFDGTSPPYAVTALPNPLNKYGLSKAAGEKAVMATSQDNIVLRVPVLYGQVESLDESAVTVLFSKVKDPSCKAVMNHCERRYPTSTYEIAKAVKILMEARCKDSSLTGHFHWSGSEMMTKYDMALAMAQMFGLSSDHLVADTAPSTGAPRPYDCCLDTSRLAALGAVHSTSFKEGVKAVLEKFAS